MAETAAKPKKKKSIVQIVSNVLLAAGLAMVLVFGVYEGVNYPWMTLFAQWGWVTPSNDLANPAPLPAAALTAGAGEDLSDKTSGIPGQESWFTERPPMFLTQLGILNIPKIQIAENIVEGSGDAMLYAVGHVRGTSLPGEEGNCVLCAHRNYVYMRPFRYLDKMEVDDLVFVRDDANTYTYKVFQVFEVNPSDSWVMEPQEGESHMLTLLTCTPVMTFTHRLIVWCRLVDTQPSAAV